MSLFYELIQISLGTRDTFSVLPTNSQWADLFEEANKQCVVGVTYVGVEKVVKQCGGIKESGISSNVLAFWYSCAQKIEERNKELNEKSAWLQKWFDKQGINTCILKGQGNAMLYPTPLLRHGGDIDIWVWKKNNDNDGLRNRSDVIKWVKSRSKNKNLDVCLHHIAIEPLGDVEVEAHFWPTFFFSLPRLIKFERWCTDQHLSVMSNWRMLPDGKECISVPTDEFNLLFQLIHIMRHLFAEGIGLRHIIDYYWLLRHYTASTERNDKRVLSSIHKFGLDAMLGGITWILIYMLGMPEHFALCKPNSAVGAILLEEMERGGNFGQSDEQVQHMLKQSKFKLFFWRTWRNIKIMKICPSEVMWSPVYRIYQWMWIRHNS